MGRAHQQLMTLLPPGLIATKSWLMEKSVPRHTVDNWLKSGWVVSAARGVYKRPESAMTWQGVICSLQRMGFDLTPGGLTALEMQGFNHFLSIGSQSVTYLYGSSHLPKWGDRLILGTRFERHTPLELTCEKEVGLRQSLWHTQVMPFGNEKCSMRISSPELALLELLMDVPHSVSFEHAENLLQGLPNLSPQKVTRLLEHCKNVKVKRLLLWLAESNQSPWLKGIDLRQFSIEGGTLGSGKRVVAEGGKLVRKYLITVPPEMAFESNG